MTFCKQFLIFLTLAAGLLMGCEKEPEAYAPPEILSPAQHALYYPDQLITLKWKVPDSTQIVEMQFLPSRDSSFLTKGRQVFDTLSFSQPYTKATEYRFTVDAYLQQKTYYGFRLRYKGAKGSSNWTPVRYFSVYPYATLSVKPLTFTATFDLIASQGSAYYSGLSTSTNTVNIDSLLLASGYSLSKLKFIKPASGYVSDAGPYASHFDRLAIGLVPKPSGAFPFDALADTYLGSIRSPLTFYPNGGRYRNLYEDLGGKKVNMQLAYFLSGNYQPAVTTGVAHHLLVSITTNCYFEQ